MNVDYDVLKKLQVVLAEMFEIEDKIKDIPRDYNDKQAVLQKTKIDYLEMCNKCDTIKKEVEDLWNRYTTVGQEKEAKEKQMEVTTLSRECESLLKEIEEAKSQEQYLLKNYNAKKKFLGELEMKLEASAEVLKIQEEEVAEETQRMDTLIAEQEALLAEKKSECDALSEGLPENLLFKFERIIRNKAGLGVVPVHGIICQGCYMELPIQFANEVRKNEDIHFCPYCSRILFYEESEEDGKFQDEVHGDIHNEEEEEMDTEVFSSDENLFED